jgi:nitroreductase
MPEREIKDEWFMCWECHRCLAYCPTGALYICDKDPANSYPIEVVATGEQLDAFITNRRSCRNYLQKNVDKELINHILKIVGTQPTGSCNQLVEFTVINDIKTMNKLREILYEELWEKTEQGVYPYRFTKEDLEMIRSFYDKGEDIVFRGAPHLLIPHAPIGRGEWTVDTCIALSYTELLMAAHGLSAIILSFIWAAIEILPKTKMLFNIPDDHFIQCFLAFGYPSLKPYRGVQRFDYLKVNQVQIS